MAFTVSSTLFLATCTVLQSVNSQIIAVKVNATLPTPRDHTAAFYDGSDSIYIFGGLHQSGAISEILQYSISSEILAPVSTFPVVRYAGSLSSDAFGYIYYAGGISSSEIFRYSVPFQRVVNVTTLPGIRSDSASVQEHPSSEVAYILGGFYDRTGIIRFNMADLTTERVGELPQNFTNILAVSDNEGSAYIFGNPVGPEYPDHFHVHKMNISTLEIKPVGEDTFPKIRGTSAAVWDSNDGNVYIIGGYGGLIPGIRSDSIIKWDPRTNQHSVIPVLNFPWLFDRQEFSGASAVFVESLNRIYFFGGMSQNYGTGFFTRYDNIWYIDITATAGF